MWKHCGSCIRETLVKLIPEGSFEYLPPYRDQTFETICRIIYREAGGNVWRTPSVSADGNE